MDQSSTRITRKTSYVDNMLNSLTKLSRARFEKRYDESVRASLAVDFSRFLVGVFSCAKTSKYGFTRLTRFSRRSRYDTLRKEAANEA